jgi:hypothetical protein
MQRNVMKVRMLAAAGAVAIVIGSIAGLGNYSSVKFATAAATAQQPYATESVQLAIQPSRIDVVGTRLARTRTAAHVQEAAAPRPQS